jgi:hypothetical protein
MMLGLLIKWIIIVYKKIIQNDIIMIIFYKINQVLIGL